MPKIAARFTNQKVTWWYQFLMIYSGRGLKLLEPACHILGLFLLTRGILLDDDSLPWGKFLPALCLTCRNFLFPTLSSPIRDWSGVPHTLPSCLGAEQRQARHRGARSVWHYGRDERRKINKVIPNTGFFWPFSKNSRLKNSRLFFSQKLNVLEIFEAAAKKLIWKNCS